MDLEDPRTTGARLRLIHRARQKSLRVVAGLAGLSKSHLSRLERGERALDSRAEVVALANALQIAPSELTSMPIPAPGNGGTDAAVETVRVALMAVNHRHPGGEVLPVAALRKRVEALVAAGCEGDQERTGRELPGLIRDLHTSMAAGRDVAELHELAALLHTQGTIGWLRTAGASVDLVVPSGGRRSRQPTRRRRPCAGPCRRAGAAHGRGQRLLAGLRPEQHRVLPDVGGAGPSGLRHGRVRRRGRAPTAAHQPVAPSCLLGVLRPSTDPG